MEYRITYPGNAVGTWRPFVPAEFLSRMETLARTDDNQWIVEFKRI